MARDVVCAHSGQVATADALAELRPQLSDIDAVAIVFFCSSDHDGIAIERALKSWAPKAEIIGCTTAGEFTHLAYTQGGVSVFALSGAKVKRCAATMATYGAGVVVETAVHEAANAIATKLQVDLRELDPDHWVGVVMNDGLNNNEEEVNTVLGHVAPLLSFVGGSAGDNFGGKPITIKETKVFHDGREASNGSVFLLMELAVPYVILKTSSYAPTDKRMRIGRVTGRIVHEIDGKPAAVGYAEKVGVKPEELNNMVFAANPLGIMINGEPWVRSAVAVMPNQELMFGCRVREGADLQLLRSTDLIHDTNDALLKSVRELGKTPSCGLLFNCVHRLMTIHGLGLEGPFRESIGAFPVAGFNSYGENWLAFMNATLIGLLIG
ncbi:MAG: hypothetical protein HOW73_46680 [Polyangiaceae bacterium]|nr:hypothetical protein [Polyangiaceae bacterium]